MEQYVVVVEAGYKSGSANYRVNHTDPMPEREARAVFDALHAGTSELLPGVDGAVVVDVSDTQFLRFRRKHGATSLDRVTLGAATTQQV